MKVGSRSVRAELPRLDEIAAPPPSDLGPEELRLRAPAPARRAEAELLGAEAPASGSVLGFVALGRALSRLGSEELDAEALAVLDAAGRAALAPKLAAVREMARTVEGLLSMREEAMARLRSQGGA